MEKVIATVKCETAAELLDQLALLCKDSHLSTGLDSEINSDTGDVFTGFQISEITLSDKSRVLNFTLISQANVEGDG